MRKLLHINIFKPSLKCDTYDNEEELVEEKEEKIRKINKRSMTNKDLDEEIKRERALELWTKKFRK